MLGSWTRSMADATQSHLDELAAAALARPWDYAVQADALAQMERLLQIYRLNGVSAQAVAAVALLSPEQCIALCARAWPFVPPLQALLGAAARRRAARCAAGAGAGAGGSAAAAAGAGRA